MAEELTWGQEVTLFTEAKTNGAYLKAAHTYSMFVIQEASKLHDCDADEGQADENILSSDG